MIKNGVLALEMVNFVSATNVTLIASHIQQFHILITDRQAINWRRTAKKFGEISVVQVKVQSLKF